MLRLLYHISWKHLDKCICIFGGVQRAFSCLFFLFQALKSPRRVRSMALALCKAYAMYMYMIQVHNAFKGFVRCSYISLEFIFGFEASCISFFLSLHPKIHLFRSSMKIFCEDIIHFLSLYIYIFFLTTLRRSILQLSHRY